MSFTEQAVVIHARSPLIGVVTQPDAATRRAGAPAVLLLNSGLIHRVGPNRLYVQWARRLAERGLTVLRFDLSAIGDSVQRRDTVPFQTSSVEETRAAMDHLRQHFGAQRFVLGGICTGAVVSFRTALQDADVAGLVLINTQGLVNNPSAALRESIAERAGARYYVSSALRRKGAWTRLLTGKADYRAVARAGVQTLMGKLGQSKAVASPEQQEIVSGLERLLREKRRLLMLYSDTDPGLDELAAIYGERELDQLKRTPGLSYTVVPQADHMFTAVEQQNTFLAAVTDWVSNTAAAA